jgi:hypothetical protein
VRERSSGGVSISEVYFAAAGGALLVVGFLWGRELMRQRTSERRAQPAPAARTSPPATVRRTAERAVPGSILEVELERLAGVAVSHGPDDPALDVFLAFVGALDPLPDAATLRPAAQRIGRLRLEEALNRPGVPHLGARRLLTAAHEATELSEPVQEVTTVTVERPVEPTRRVPELFEALLHAIRAALSIFV